MRFTFQTHNGWFCLLAAVLCGVGAGVYGQQLISVPFLGSLLMPTQMPLAVIPSLILSTIAGAAISGAGRNWTNSSVRNSWSYSFGLLLVSALLAVTVCSLVSAPGEQGVSLTLLFARDLFGLLAIWIVGICVGLKQSATLLPISYVVFSSAFARNKSAEFFPWAWIMEPHPYSTVAGFVIICGLVSGLLLVARRRPLR